MTPEEIIEQEKARRRAELQALIGQIQAVQSIASSLKAEVTGMKSTMEQALLIDGHMYKEGLYGKALSSSSGVQSNLSNAIGIVQSEMGNI